MSIYPNWWCTSSLRSPVSENKMTSDRRNFQHQHMVSHPCAPIYIHLHILPYAYMHTHAVWNIPPTGRKYWEKIGYYNFHVNYFFRVQEWKSCKCLNWPYMHVWLQRFGDDRLKNRVQVGRGTFHQAFFVLDIFFMKPEEAFALPYLMKLITKHKWNHRFKLSIFEISILWLNEVWQN